MEKKKLNNKWMKPISSWAAFQQRVNEMSDLMEEAERVGWMNDKPSASAVSSSTKTNLFLSRWSEGKDGLLLKERDWPEADK